MTIRMSPTVRPRCRQMPAPMLFLFVFAAFSPALLLAQGDSTGNATIIGTVLDQSGTPISQAAVAIKNEASGAVRSTKTGPEGRFSVTNLPAGTYAVDVSVTGFATDSRIGLRVASATMVPLTITVNVASVSQSVTVEAAVTLAVEAAPSQSSLDAKSAESVISSTYIRNFIRRRGTIPTCSRCRRARLA